MGARPHQRRPHTHGIHKTTSQPRLQRWRGTPSRCGPARDLPPAVQPDVPTKRAAPRRPPLGRLVTSGAGTSRVLSQPAHLGRRPSCTASKANRLESSRRAPSRAVQQWRPGAVLSKVHLSRHCGLHRTAQVPKRTAQRAATMVPRSAAHVAPSGRRAGVTETARSPRPQSQWARLADSAPRHRQEAKVFSSDVGGDISQPQHRQPGACSP